MYVIYKMKYHSSNYFLPSKVYCNASEMWIMINFFSNVNLFILNKVLWFPADETLIWITKCFDNFWSNTARWWKNFWRIDLPPDVAPYCFWYLSTKIQQLYFNNISNIELHVLVLPFAASIIFMYCICIYLFLLSSFSKVGT